MKIVQSLGLAAVCFVLGGTALAADAEALFKEAAIASAKYLQAAHLCAPILGDAYVGAAKIMVEGVYRLAGYSGDDLTIAVDDADKQAAAIAGKYDIKSLIGKNGVTEGNVATSCMEQLNAALDAASVAQARARKAASAASQPLASSQTAPADSGL